MEVVSRTAVWVAAARAVGAREPDMDVRNPDYLAERLLGDVSQYDVDVAIVDALDEPYADAMSDPETAAMVRTMTVRSRFVDDALDRAIDAGVKQVLILGAGFDSHAYRFEDRLESVRVFEVDRPLTLAMKRERVQQVLGRVPENLTYVDADLETDDLAGMLAEAGYDVGLPSFVLMEGLTMYLHEEAIGKLFAFVNAHPPGSAVVFDFVTAFMVAGITNVNLDEVPDAGRAFVQRFLHLVRDEPFRFGFPVGEERQYIESKGFEVGDLIVLDGEEAVRRYLKRADGSEVGEEGMARRPPVPPQMARMRESMSYRICEALVPHKH
jgi:methyltransferase (TIGR00027 family)